MSEIAAPSISKRIEQNSALIFIIGVVSIFGYVSLKDNGPGILFYLAAFLGVCFFVISGLYRSLLKREVAIYLLTAYLPFSNHISGGFGIKGLNFTNILILLVAFLWFKSCDKNKPFFAKTTLNIPIFIFLGLGIFSVLRGIPYGLGYLVDALIEYYQIWVIPFFLYFFTVNSGHDEKTVKNIVKIIMIVTLIIGLMSIYEYHLDGDDRVGGVMNQPNQLAAFFNYYIYLFFAFFLVYRKYSWMFLLFFLIGFRGIMVTFSRGGYLSFLAGMYAIICFRSRMLLFLLVLATVFLIFNPAFIPEGIRYRMSQTFEKQKTQSIEAGAQFDSSSLDTSSGDRLKVWKGAINMIEEHPLFGVGYFMFEKKVLHYWTGWQSHDPHNSYLLIAAEMGVPALLAFCLMIWQIFSSSRKLYKISSDPFVRSVALGMLAGISSLLVSNIYGSRLNYTEVTCYFWILAGIVVRWKMLAEEKLKRA